MHRDELETPMFGTRPAPVLPVEQVKERRDNITAISLPHNNHEDIQSTQALAFARFSLIAASLTCESIWNKVRTTPARDDVKT